jgi:hypothetical protein
MKLKHLIPVLALFAMASSVEAITKKNKSHKAKCKNQKVTELNFTNNSGEDIDIAVKFTFVGTNVLGKNGTNIPSPKGKVHLENIQDGQSATARSADAIYMPKKGTDEKKAMIAPTMKKTESICVSAVFVKAAGSKYRGQNVWNNKTMRDKTNFDVIKEGKSYKLKAAQGMYTTLMGE